MVKITAKNNGFTLIELLMTLAIAAVVATVGIPSFTSTMNSNRLTTNINEFITSLNYARSEAVKRNQTVTMLKKSATAGEWHRGWDVFTDLDADGVLDVGDGDTLLRTYDNLPGGIILHGSSPTYDLGVIYQATGMINASGSFALCNNSDNNNAPEAYTSRLVNINAVGRPSMAIDSDGDGIPELANTSEITSCVSPFV